MNLKELWTEYFDDMASFPRKSDHMAQSMAGGITQRPRYLVIFVSVLWTCGLLFNGKQNFELILPLITKNRISENVFIPFWKKSREISQAACANLTGTFNVTKNISPGNLQTVFDGFTLPWHSFKNSKYHFDTIIFEILNKICNYCILCSVE